MLYAPGFQPLVVRCSYDPKNLEYTGSISLQCQIMPRWGNQLLTKFTIPLVGPESCLASAPASSAIRAVYLEDK